MARALVARRGSWDHISSGVAVPSAAGAGRRGSAINGWPAAAETGASDPNACDHRGRLVPRLGSSCASWIENYIPRT